MSTISASTTSTTAYKVTADTTGTLVFQTGASPTTAMTLGSDQSVTFAGTPTYSGGTANGVAYLNGSKVFTTGSALQFDGTNLGVGVTPASWLLYKAFQTGSTSVADYASGNNALFGSNVYYGGSPSDFRFITAATTATLYRQVNGTHTWNTSGATTGAAGGLISLNQAMTLDSSGNLLVGTTSASNSTNTFFKTSGANLPALCAFKNSGNTSTDNAFVVTNGAAGGTNSFIVLANGNALNTNNSYGAISDVRLKENIEDATPKLADLMQVKIRQYNLIADEEKQKQLGVVADELETVFPAMVTEDNDGFKNVKYSVFVPMLIKAIQEQQAIIEQLQADIATLKGAA